MDPGQAGHTLHVRRPDGDFHKALIEQGPMQKGRIDSKVRAGQRGLDGNLPEDVYKRQIPWWRDGGVQPVALPSPAPLRHIGLYAYRVGFLRRFPQLSHAPMERTEALEQLRVLWHGERIAVHVADHGPGPGVDTAEDLARVRALFAAVDTSG